MIGRKCYRALVLSFLTATCAHALDVGGHIQTTTWTAADSPVRVTDTVYVDVGATLTIGPGVDVLFDAEVPFCVAGSLVAQGTESDSIRFLPGTADVWQSVTFCEGAAGTLAYVRVSGSRGPDVMTLPEPFVMATGGGLSFRGAAATLSHVVIQGNSTSESGGGMAVIGGTLTMDQCLVRANRAAWFGGGLELGSLDSVAISGCTIAENSPSGVRVNGSSVVMTDCEVRGNAYASADDHESGGVHIRSGVVRLVSCLIADNTALWSGAGILHGHGTLTTRMCTFTGNRAPQGSALSIDGEVAEILNCTFADNGETAPGEGYPPNVPSAIELTDGTLSMVNSIVWGNDGAAVSLSGVDSARCHVDYCDLETDEVWPGTGNLNADPLFVAPEAGDYGLQAGSPCIDSGSLAWLDEDGSRSDMGSSVIVHSNSAYPRPTVTQTGDCSSTVSGVISMTNIGDDVLTVFDLELPDDFVTSTVFPTTVEPHGTLLVYVGYTNTSRDTVAIATIRHDDPIQGDVEVPLRGIYGTVVSGYQYGRWTRADSPYRVVGTVQVPRDKELIIDAGVHVLFEKADAMNGPYDDGGLHALGRLTVEGTEGDSVVFRMGRPDARGGVVVHLGPGGRMSYAAFDGLVGSVESTDGGGIECTHCVFRNMPGVVTDCPEGLVLSDCAIKHCSPAVEVSGRGSTVWMTGCSVTDCYGEEPIRAVGGTLRMDNCLIARNHATHPNPSLDSYLIAIRSGAEVVLARCTVTGNSGQSAGVFLVREGILHALGSILSGNTGADVTLLPSYEAEVCSLDIQYSDVRWVRTTDNSEFIDHKTGYPGEGSIAADPLFIDAAAGDYHLAAGSPCIDAGHPYYLDADSSPADMGVFGGTGPRSSLPEVRAVAQAEIGRTIGGVVDVWNIGGGPLTVDSISFTLSFSTTMVFPQTVPAGDTLHIPVVFDPDPVADMTGTATVYHSDAYRAPGQHRHAGPRGWWQPVGSRLRGAYGGRQPVPHHRRSARSRRRGARDRARRNVHVRHRRHHSRGRQHTRQGHRGGQHRVLPWRVSFRRRDQADEFRQQLLLIREVERPRHGSDQRLGERPQCQRRQQRLLENRYVRGVRKQRWDARASQLLFQRLHQSLRYQPLPEDRRRRLLHHRGLRRALSERLRRHLRERLRPLRLHERHRRRVRLPADREEQHGRRQRRSPTVGRTHLPLQDREQRVRIPDPKRGLARGNPG